jgi:hypothetical protein
MNNTDYIKKLDAIKDNHSTSFIDTVDRLVNDYNDYLNSKCYFIGIIYPNNDDAIDEMFDGLNYKVSEILFGTDISHVNSNDDFIMFQGGTNCLVSLTHLQVFDNYINDHEFIKWCDDNNRNLETL